MAIFPQVTIGSDVYDALDLGYYMLNTSTSDEPKYLKIVTPTINSNGRSNISFSFEEHADGSYGADDLLAKLRVTYTWDAGHPNATAFADLLANVADFTAIAGMKSDLLKGFR